MIDKLIEKIKATAPIVVGLDPTLEMIPEAVKAAAYAEKGESLEGAALAFLNFNRAIIDAVAPLVPAVKPQIAMYERFGLPGLEAYEKTVTYAQSKGLIVIGDVKRGDIGSTSAAYAEAHLGTARIGEKNYAPFHEDFATVNPYLGTDGIKPFLDVCRREDKGIFVLVKTSNPSSGEFQDQLLPDGRPLYEHVGEKVSDWGKDLIGEAGFSAVGAVVGATYPEMGSRLRELMPEVFFLVPGYGAQGGTAADLAGFFREDGLGAIVNSSRGIIAAWQKEEYAHLSEENFSKASRLAVENMIEELSQVMR